MFTPPAYHRDELPVLHGHIEAHGFATLVTLGSHGLIASHIPILIDKDVDPYGRLRGHFARANPQWRDIDPKMPALAIFQGPNAYVSPNWYASRREHGKVVPTWNYTAVHASGFLDVTEDADVVAGIVNDLTEKYERQSPQPWRISDAPADFIRGQLKGIVGFEMAITKLEGKWKMSQNKPQADRRGAIEGLASSEREICRDVAAVMAGLEGD